MSGNLGPQARDGCGKLVAAPRRLAQPERDRRRLAVRVLDPDDAAADPEDAIGGVAELEDVAGHALDREVLVDRADQLIFRFQDHLVVGGVRNRAARGQRGQPRAAPAAQHVVDRVVMDQGTPPAAARAEARGQHDHDCGEVLARQVSVGPGAAHQHVEVVLRPFARRDLGDDLLRQHVQLTLGDDKAVELAAADAVQKCRAFDQLVPGQREQAALGRAVDRVAGAPDPLEKARDRARRAELADEVDLADVDAELERGGRDQRFERAALEALLGIEPLLLGEAAVVGGDLALAEALRQLAGHPLGQPPGIDEDQRRAMRLDQPGQPVVELLPDVGRHHGFERRVRDLEREVARAAVAGVDDRALVARATVRAGADQEARHLLDRLLGRREPDPQ